MKYIFLKKYFLLFMIASTIKCMPPANLFKIPFGPQRDAYVLTHNMDGTKIPCQSPLLTISLTSFFAQLKSNRSSQEYKQRATETICAMATYHTTCKNPCFLCSLHKNGTLKSFICS